MYIYSMLHLNNLYNNNYYNKIINTCLIFTYFNIDKENIHLNINIFVKTKKKSSLLILSYQLLFKFQLYLLHLIS